MKILLATPCGGGVVRYEYCQSLLTEAFCAPDRLNNQARYQLALYQVGGESGLGKDRGVIASYALRNGFDKLFFIDSDQTWRWDQFKAIVDSEKKIIAGVVPLKKYPIQLNFTPMVEDMECFKPEDDQITPKGLKRLHHKYGCESEIAVQCMGTAFMCVDVSVLSKLVEGGTCPPFFYADPHTQTKVQCWDFFQSGAISNLYFGEDWGFCAVAKRAGFQSYINSTIHVDHIGDHRYQMEEKHGT